jgi:hypothetical protein
MNEAQALAVRGHVRAVGTPIAIAVDAGTAAFD